jgi:hypothetical protein
MGHLQTAGYHGTYGKLCQEGGGTVPDVALRTLCKKSGNCGSETLRNSPGVGPGTCRVPPLGTQRCPPWRMPAAPAAPRASAAVSQKRLLKLAELPSTGDGTAPPPVRLWVIRGRHCEVAERRLQRRRKL